MLSHFNNGATPKENLHTVKIESNQYLKGSNHSLFEVSHYSLSKAVVKLVDNRMVLEEPDDRPM